MLKALIFQSTLPRGSDTEAAKAALYLSQFQSTLPRGSDERSRQWAIRCMHISIHAPSRERPFCLADQWPAKVISIHAPSRERQMMLLALTVMIQFQSTLPRGSDRLQSRRFPRTRNFNPRSLAGATFCFSCFRA